MHNIKKILENNTRFIEKMKQRNEDVELEINKIEIFFKKKVNYNKELEQTSIAINSYNSKLKDILNNKDVPRNKQIKLINDHRNQLSNISENKQDLIKLIKEVDKNIFGIAKYFPNVSHETTPIGKDSNDNKVLDIHNNKYKATHNLSYIDIAKKLDLIDFERSQAIFGTRSAIFKGQGLELFKKLIDFSLEHNKKEKYTEISAPVLLPEILLYGSGQLPKFENDLFKITESNKYLSPTGEVSLVGIYNNSLINYDNLPIKLTTASSCFRREVGSAGKDTKGLLRLHQFNKVEIVQFCDPEESSDIHNKMIDHVCSLLNKLHLSYRKVELCSGDLGFSSAKTIDIEVYFPIQKKYIEVSSISNCLSFQSRRSKIRYKKDGKVIFPHTLNGSSLAIERTLSALIETHYDGKKIVVPKVLK